ncbi:MAG TPA: ring-cleaving dioxygenase [Terriglobales bacterium]|nr:ring-cleaving dioxygenase [Terriglobales bacterium]
MPPPTAPAAPVLPPILGLHHVSAIAGDPQRVLDFYTEVLGLRLVKRTVNFDDPGTYHLYFGDEQGRPGSLLTFFPWPRARRGRAGVGQASAVAFAVPAAALGWWEKRLQAAAVPVERLAPRFGAPVLRAADPDGLRLEMVGDAELADTPHQPWHAASVPPAQAIRGFDSVTLCQQGFESTAALLRLMGFRPAGEEANRYRFVLGAGGAATRCDLQCSAEAPYGTSGAGTVHHVAWRVDDDPAQRDWRAHLAALRLNVTPVIDREYFRSIYFREPGGVLFEIATDPPGFTVDEPLAELGGTLRLPPWLEPERQRIEAVLPPLHAHPPVSAT